MQILKGTGWESGVGNWKVGVKLMQALKRLGSESGVEKYVYTGF